MPTTPLQDSDLATLAKFDSPTIANVIELFECRAYNAGYTNETIRAVYPKLPPVVGYAATMTFRASQPAGRGEPFNKIGQVIEQYADAQRPLIAVIKDLDEPHVAATYGEIVVTCLKTFGFVGLMTDGAGRDYEQVQRLGFPCWTSSMIVSHGYNHLLDLNIPVLIGGLSLEPKDLLHADGNGIIHIPLPIASAVAELCEPFVAAEEVILEYTRDPGLTMAGLQEAIDKKNELVAGLMKQAKKMIPESW